jgi:hypothetical protein
MSNPLIMLRPISTNSIFTKSILKLILLTALLTGCSSTSLVYNNADWLVRGKINDYFPLSASQKQQLKSDIDTIIQWHRRQELAEYSNLLNQFTQQYTDGLTSEALDLFFDKVSSARIRIVETSIPTASQFLSTVSVKQIDYYDRVFLEKRTEQAKEIDTPSEEYDDKNFIDFIKNVEEWFGDFDEKQMTQSRIISDARPDNRQYWFERSQLRHQKFSELLRSHPSKEEIEQYLHDRFIALKQTDAQEYDISRQLRLYWLNALLSIDKIITMKQREHFISRVSDYSSDFLMLSKQSIKPFRSGNIR